MALSRSLVLLLALGHTSLFGMDGECQFRLRQYAAGVAPSRISLPHYLRVAQFVDKIPDSATSPILRTVFPQAYKGGYDKNRLLIYLDSFVAEVGTLLVYGEDSPRIGSMVSEFFRRLATVANTHAYLKESPNFQQFAATQEGELGAQIVNSGVLDSFWSGEGWAGLRSKLPALYNVSVDGIIPEFSDAEIAKSDDIARELLSDVPISNDLIAYVGLVERYREHLHAKGEWDVALSLYGPGVSLKDYPPGEFLEKKLHAGLEQWEVVEFVGSGGENFVYRVENLLTRETKILKITNPRAYVNLEQNHILRQHIENAGIPVVRMQNLGPNFNFVEEIKYFGSDVVREYVLQGRSSELASMKKFYKNLLDTSTLSLQDLKPDNIGKRADGTWVITDWAFHLYSGQRNASLNGRIEERELGMQLCKGVWEVYDELVKKAPRNKALYKKHALSFVHEMFTDLKIELPINMPARF